jgi:hypothetical protein
MNPAFPINQRVYDLIGRMTLEEKVSQMQAMVQKDQRRKA